MQITLGQVKCVERKERSTKNVTMKGKTAIQKVKSKKEGKINTTQTNQCDDTVNRQKRNCKKIDAQRNIGRKLKS